MYTNMSNLHKKDGLFIYMYIKYTAKNITVNQTKKSGVFFQNTKDNIYFIFVKNY